MFSIKSGNLEESEKTRFHQGVELSSHFEHFEKSMTHDHDLANEFQIKSEGSGLDNKITKQEC